jgi:uncharacterized membrane protein YccC
MKIQGPISVSVQDDDVQAKRTLEINFTEAFQQNTHEQQVAELKSYIQSLFQNAESLPEGQADREGILLIMQICEQLLPLLQQQELDLTETISLEMGLASLTPEISVSLADFKIN